LNKTEKTVQAFFAINIRYIFFEETADDLNRRELVGGSLLAMRTEERAGLKTDCYITQNVLQPPG
jgi:membrane-bound lytic murein transglycosylase